MKPETETANRPPQRRARRIKRHEMRKHLAALKLSPEAYRIQEECFEATDYPIYREIARRIQEATGEIVTIQQLSRSYHGYWKGHLAAKSERAERRIDAISLLKIKYKLGDEMAERIITDLLNQAILFNEKQLTDSDPVALLREQTRRERVGVEREKVAIERDKVSLLKSKLEAATASMVKTLEKAAGRSATPGEMKNIREKFYGLVEEK